MLASRIFICCLGWLAATRAFFTSGVILIIVCMALMAMYIGTPIMSRRTNIALLFGVTLFTGE